MLEFTCSDGRIIDSCCSDGNSGIVLVLVLVVFVDVVVFFWFTVVVLEFRVDVVLILFVEEVDDMVDVLNLKKFFASSPRIISIEGVGLMEYIFSGEELYGIDSSTCFKAFMRVLSSEKPDPVDLS